MKSKMHQTCKKLLGPLEILIYETNLSNTVFAMADYENSLENSLENSTTVLFLIIKVVSFELEGLSHN